MHCTVIGIDVAKDSLSLYRADQDQAGTSANEPRAIAAWLRGLPQECSLAIEATNTYHVAVRRANCALAQSFSFLPSRSAGWSR